MTLVTTRERSAQPMTIRGRLLLSVNFVLGTLLIALSFVEYQRGLDAGVGDRLAALDEEAAAILGAVVHLRHGHGPDDVRKYVEEICRRRCEQHAPWHRIEVEWPGTVLRARPGEPDSEALSAALQRVTSSNGRGSFGRRNIVVGNARGGGTAVYVAESTDDIRRSVRGDVLRGLAALAALGVVAAGIVNAVLLAVVVRPIERLAVAVREIGGGRLGLAVEAAESRETHLLAEAINAMSASLAEADGERRAQMEKARRLQEHLLPRRRAVPGLEYSYLFRPADEVAGDYFDLLPLSDNGVLICVADVTGHGVPAALGAAMLKTLLAQAAERPDVRPGAMLEFINDRFAAVSLPGNFASVFLARWHLGTRTLEYSSAGHEPGYFLTGGSLRELQSTGPLLGIEDHARWDTDRVTVVEGDRLVLFTDGVVEAAGIERGSFGRTRLKQVVTDDSCAPLDRLVGRLGQEVNSETGDFRPTDDMTVLAVEFRNVGPISLPFRVACPRAC